MIKNVNLMQNEADIIFDEQSGFSREHIIQALANLGQRIGIKGDSISYKYFTFNDILTNVSKYSPDKYIGFIEYFKDDNTYKAKFGVTNKFQLNNSNDEIINDTTINIDDIFVFPSELSFTVPISGIEKYSKNSICINDNNELTIMLAEKIIGYDDDDEYNTVLLYHKFNTISNKLIEGYKLFHIDNDVICMLNIKANNLKDNKYTLKIRTFDINKNFISTEDADYSIYINDFKNLFKFTSYDNTNIIPFSIIKSDYKDINKLKSYLYKNVFSFSNNSAISIIENFESNFNELTKLSQNELSIELNFDTNKNELLSTDNYDYIRDTALNEYRINLDEEIFIINEDINKLYVDIFKYYNKKYYLDNKSTFIRRILSKIYEKASNYEYAGNHRLYIPLDYNFHYICNSNNELNIFYSNNIYVTYTKLSKYDLKTFWDSNTSIVYDYDLIDKLKVYNFEISYNSIDETLINSVDIKDIYTMPYINAENNWSINDIDSKITAIGKDAGNPNIIVIFSKTYKDIIDSHSLPYNVLNSISKKNVLDKAKYECRSFNVNSIMFTNPDHEYVCNAWVPVIDDTNYEELLNSIIFNISDLDCLELESAKTKYKGSYIYTLWYPVETKGKLSFECMKDDTNEYVLTLGATVNKLVETSNYNKANLNDQDILLLKAVISNVAQESLSTNNNNWLILKNKSSEEYTGELNISTSEYNNDLNAIIQYNNKVELDDNGLVNNSQKIINNKTSKYIDYLNNVQFTNKLYPKYKYESSLIEKTTTIPVAINALKNVSEYNSKITVRGQRVTNVESLISHLQNIKTVSNVSVKKLAVDINIEKTKKLQTLYKEYVFDENIPTIDFKEVFNRNINVLNRVNILSLDPTENKIYNAFIGTSFNDSNKSTLHIGSSNVNINVGSSTLIDETEKSKFAVHDTLALDFNNIELNSNNIKLNTKKICSTKNIINEYKNNDRTYYMQTIRLIGQTTLKPLNHIETDRINNIVWGETGIFVKASNTLDIYMISLNYIFKAYFNLDISTKYNVIINNVNTDDISYIPTANETVFNNYISSNNILKGNVSINDYTKNMYLIKITDNLTDNLYPIESEGIIYCGYVLDIMYYVTENFLNIYLTFK